MIATGFLDVGNGHQIRWETHGNPNGIPVAFLHGGPGSGFQPYHPGLFDLDKVFLILHDQRGCGDSRFTQQLNGNTTEALLADIEALRKHFGLEKWWICGHSWGATLAVLYAAQHSTQCLGAIPVSSFLARREDTFTLFRNLEAKYPEQWRAFTALLGNDIAASMSACLAGGDAEKRNTLLSLYAAMEGSVADFEKAWRRGNVYWSTSPTTFSWQTVLRRRRRASPLPCPSTCCTARTILNARSIMPKP